jgi:hypothetical protein
VAVPAQRGPGNRHENGQGDIGTAGATAPVVAGAHPGQREIDVGEGLAGAGDNQRADFVQSPGRLSIRTWPVPRQRHAVLGVGDEMGKLLTAEDALFLEFLAQGG